MQQCDEHLLTSDLLASPEKIMVATDLQDLDRLLPHVIAQAKASGSTVTIVHAIYPMYVASLETAVVPCDYETAIVGEVRAKLQDAVRRMEAEGIKAEVRVRIGSAGEVIREELRRSHSSRLIMGTHGRGMLRQFALGSVAHELITKVGIPIFVVGPRARAHTLHAAPRRILHPVSFVGEYRANCKLAIEIASIYGAELTLLHVLEQTVDESVNPDRAVRWAEATLRQIISEASDPVPRISTRVLFGKVAAEILRAAGEIDADWIVLSTDEGSNSGLFKETRAFEVLAAATCPVLTLGR
jgi:nucleotide-binding universal stress UspA family protein